MPSYKYIQAPFSAVQIYDLQHIHLHSSSSTGTVEARVSGHPRNVKTLSVAGAGRLRGSGKQPLEL